MASSAGDDEVEQRSGKGRTVENEDDDEIWNQIRTGKGRGVGQPPGPSAVGGPSESCLSDASGICAKQVVKNVAMLGEAFCEERRQILKTKPSFKWGRSEDLLQSQHFKNCLTNAWETDTLVDLVTKAIWKEDLDTALSKSRDCVEKPMAPAEFGTLQRRQRWGISRPLGAYDTQAVTEMREIALGYDAEWLESDRPTRTVIHSKTQNIELLGQDGSHNFPEVKPPKKHRDWSRWKPYLHQLANHTAKLYGYPALDIWRANVVRLPAGEVIKRHRDRFPGLLFPHRVHLPLQSAAGTEFASSNYQTGELFELNNIEVHWVNNTSPLDRVHLILDMYPICDGKAQFSWETRERTGMAEL